MYRDAAHTLANVFRQIKLKAYTRNLSTGNMNIVYL